MLKVKNYFLSDCIQNLSLVVSNVVVACLVGPPRILGTAADKSGSCRTGSVNSSPNVVL